MTQALVSPSAPDNNTYTGARRFGTYRPRHNAGARSPDGPLLTGVRPTRRPGRGHERLTMPERGRFNTRRPRSLLAHPGVDAATVHAADLRLRVGRGCKAPYSGSIPLAASQDVRAGEDRCTGRWLARTPSRVHPAAPGRGRCRRGREATTRRTSRARRRRQRPLPRTSPTWALHQGPTRAESIRAAPRGAARSDPQRPRPPPARPLSRRLWAHARTQQRRRADRGVQPRAARGSLADTCRS